MVHLFSVFPGLTLQPVFHEGTKYNACCPKRKVLEFDEFMKIEGCKEGSHLFVGAKKDEVSHSLSIW